jgi:hydroxymethylbilane synthase
VGLILGAVGKRADVRDALVCRAASFRLPPVARRILDGLPQGATVATSSTRRSAQLLDRRPDLKTVPIRGNVGTRLKKVAGQHDLAATILAAAGLARLNIQAKPDGQLAGEGVPKGLWAGFLEPEEMLPCVGQAALGIEVREGDPRIAQVCAALDDRDTHQCVLAERAFLKAMGGGCHLAVAAYAEILGPHLRLRAVSFLGGSPRRGEARRPVAEASELGRQLAVELGAPPSSL